MRKVLNIMQSCAMAFDEVTEDNVYTCVGHPLKSEIEAVVNWLLNDTFTDAYNNINELKVLKGLSLQDILTEVHTYVQRLELPDRIKVHLLIKMSDLEHRLFNGANEMIQLGSLISTFQVTRDMIGEEAEK